MNNLDKGLVYAVVTPKDKFESEGFEREGSCEGPRILLTVDRIVSLDQRRKGSGVGALQSKSPVIG